ncbi:MAG: alpha-hydroxy acid oxidase [Myxococcota bacterium]
MDLSDLEAEAKAKLDATFYDYIAGGAEDERTLADNQDAWDRMRLRPRVLRDVTTIDTSTTMLGARVSSPVAIAPMAMQHRASPDGPVATARAAQATGALFCMGLFGAGSAAQVAAVPGNAPRWLQVYVMADRARSVEAIARSAEQGYGAIVITVDVARQGNRRRDARNRWTFLQSDGQVEDPNELFDHALTFDDIAWFAERTPIPLVVKGVARGDDAKACVDAGAAGVVVSNHGGRQLDGALATADALADVVANVAAGPRSTSTGASVAGGVVKRPSRWGRRRSSWDVRDVGTRRRGPEGRRGRDARLPGRGRAGDDGALRGDAGRRDRREPARRARLESTARMSAAPLVVCVHHPAAVDVERLGRGGATSARPIQSSCSPSRRASRCVARGSRRRSTQACSRRRRFRRGDPRDLGAGGGSC